MAGSERDRIKIQGQDVIGRTLNEIETSGDLADFIDRLVDHLERNRDDFDGELLPYMLNIRNIVSNDEFFGDPNNSRYSEYPNWRTFGNILNDALKQS